MITQRRKIWIAVLVLSTFALAILFGALAVDGPALARHPDQAVRFAYFRTAIVNPGVEWRDADGMHIRNRVETGYLTGDLQGRTRIVYNADLAHFPSLSGGGPDFPFTEGTAYGSIRIFSSMLDLVWPLWSGSWEHQYHEGRLVGGSMIAFHLDGVTQLLVDTIFPGARGGLVHVGSIEHITLCPDDDCSIDPTGQTE